MAPLILMLLLAQQFPTESQPLQPVTQVLWVEVVPDALSVQDASQQIDVLYVIASSYTTNQATADTLCSQMITRGNEVLANDPAELSRLHLVACKLITYTSVDDTTDLTAIASTSGSLYPQVNAWRNQYGADLVQLIGTFTNSCGRGYQCAAIYGAQFGYSVVQGSCAVGNYSAIHEMGHNVCLAHDINNQTPSFSYGSGFCDPAGRRDPMSYQSSASSPNPCTGGRVSYFGNPNVSPFGAPFGTVLNYDNARVWRNEAAIVAAFRAPVTPPTCPTITLLPATLPNGYTGRAYSQTFTATGGTAPYSFALTVGQVNGLSFVSPTYSGTPTTAATSQLTFRVTDAAACSTTTVYQLTILQLPTAPTNLIAQ